jgi:hypothetical protein
MVTSRRYFIKFACAQTACSLGSLMTIQSGLAQFAFASQDDREQRSIAVEAWMDDWTEREKKLTNPLILKRFADPMWVLQEPIIWEPNPNSDQGLKKVVVPSGFVTDLASIPRAFWIIFPRDGKYSYPAIVHDFLYWDQSTTKEQADNILRIGMIDIGVDRATAFTIYEAVIFIRPVCLGWKCAAEEKRGTTRTGEISR